MDAKVSHAEITKRVAACVVDAIIFLSFYLFTLFISSDKSFTEFFNYIFSDTAVISTSIQGEVLETLLFIALETLMITKFGWTPGKLLFGIYIKDVNTLKNVALMQAVIRSTLKVLLLSCISNWFFILPILVLIFATFDQRKQTFYDKIAKTVVIDYRSEKCHLNSNYVGIARRVIAHIIDCSVVMGASLVYCLLVIITLDPTESKYFIMYICLFFLLSIIFRIIMVKRVGGTPGQLLCCICIKDANTLKNITFMQAMIRYALSEVVNPVLYFVLIICFWDFFDKYVPEWLFKSLLFLVFAPTILVSIHAMFDRQKKFLHDKITRTVAIRL